MFNKRFFRILTSCALVLTLVMALAPIHAFAEGTAPTAGSNETINNPTAANSTAKFDAWGREADNTEYSVDVVWGAMTFQYEKGSWNTETHKAESGAGWVVYDNANSQVLGKGQYAINKITITNHSNATVYASLTFSPVADSGVEGGTFAATNSASEDFLATFNAATGVITLQSADNKQGSSEGEGKPTKANVYFMPTAAITPGSTQWRKIGTITVDISDKAPNEPTP